LILLVVDIFGFYFSFFFGDGASGESGSEGSSDTRDNDTEPQVCNVGFSL